jgi:hypothetical protein
VQGEDGLAQDPAWLFHFASSRSALR